ncbi:DUF2207 domain-containing protein [Bifidobacterium sp. ESL0769]|uniref:DUF2207 family protein n=1 Tax=Bifidobacterium sp. ESL0769 TaxID=2983229 RepID=UPI0023F9DDF1|nr:DUF2207 domain-containing protein [Bifidobacterium sp. ESL0769]WEV67126.1 DUF2207 domain-containing protein [Bifidobacterium sp. ESL0769]
MNGKSLNPKRIAKVLFAALVLTAMVALFAVACGSRVQPYVPYRSDFNAMKGDLIYNSLDDDVKVLPNGDLRVVEHIDMELNARQGKGNKTKPWRQLYQRYTLNRTDRAKGPLSDIIDVSVKNASNGQEYAHGTSGDITDPNWDKSHANQWYAEDVGGEKGTDHTPYLPVAMNDDQYVQSLGSAATSGATAGNKTGATAGTQAGDKDTIEIGWNIPSTDYASSIKFDIDMTFKDVVQVYDDVAYLKWEPVGKTNGAPIRNFDATVTFPNGVEENDTKEWLHYDGNGSVYPNPDGTLSADAYQVVPGRHIDLVTIYPSSVMGQVRHRLHGTQKQKVIDQERDEEKSSDINSPQEPREHCDIYLPFIILEVVVMIVGVAFVVYTNRKGSYHGPVDYYRDIPKISASAAAQFLDEMQGAQGDWKLDSRQLAATMLSLQSKKAIAIYPGESQWYAGIDWAHVTDEEIGDRMRRGAAGEFDGQPVGVIGKPYARHSSDPSRKEPLDKRLGKQKGGLVDTVRKTTGIGGRKKTSTIVLLVEVPKGTKGTNAAYNAANVANAPSVTNAPDCASNSNDSVVGTLTSPEIALMKLLQAMGQRLGSDVFDFEDVHDKLSNWSEGASRESNFDHKVEAEYHAMKLTGTSTVYTAFEGILLAAGVLGFIYLYMIFMGNPLTAIRLFGPEAVYLHGDIVRMLRIFLPVAFVLIVEILLLQKVMLTGKGNTLAAQLLGLRKYLLDFGDFKGSEPQDLKLWDQYLIYATAFGISDKLTDDMTKLWPQLGDGNWLDSNASESLLYWPLYPASHDVQGYSNVDLNLGSLADLGGQLSSGFSSMDSSFSSAGGFGGGGGSFGGSDGGSGGGSFGGR